MLQHPGIPYALVGVLALVLAAPGAAQPTTVPVVINEVDSDTLGTDAEEFIELFGPGGAALDDHFVVLYNGSTDAEYETYDLAGQALPLDGFFVIGPSGGAVPDTDFTPASFGATNEVQNGADAVALWFDQTGALTATDFAGTLASAPPAGAVLLDALVYDTDDADDAELLAALLPGQIQLNENENLSKDTHSFARTPDGSPALVTTSGWAIQDVTPGASNVAAAPPPFVVINEIDSDTVGTDALEFLELFGDSSAALDAHFVVLFNGSNDTSYEVYDLAGQAIPADGFFVIGPPGGAVANTDFTPASFGATNEVQNGADAVALYRDDSGLLTAADFTTILVSAPPAGAVLVDAAVYGTADPDDVELLAALTPGEVQLDESENALSETESSSRVPDGSPALVTSTGWAIQAATPGTTNAAGPPVEAPDVVLNEVDADTDGTDAAEFLELFGEGGTALDGLFVTLYNGSGDVEYDTYDLLGQSLPGDGYFVIGPGTLTVPDTDFTPPTFSDTNEVQNGADAVALWFDPTGTLTAGSFSGTLVSAPPAGAVLVDAIVYGTSDPDDPELLAALTPGGVQVDENANALGTTDSSGRCPDGGMAFDTLRWATQPATPGALNCVLERPQIVINEVDADQTDTDAAEFVELFAAGGTSLDGVFLILFNGSNDGEYRTFDLSGSTVPGDGFFVVGPSSGTVPNTDLSPSNFDLTNAVQNGPDAVTLWFDTTGTLEASDFFFIAAGASPAGAVLLDAVVYGTADPDDPELLAAFTPGEPQIDEDGEFGLKDTESFGRCPDGGTPFVTSSGWLQHVPSPGEPNNVSGFFGVGFGLPGTAGTPSLSGVGTLLPGDPATVSLTGAAPDAMAFFFLSGVVLNAPFKGGTLVPDPLVGFIASTMTDGLGEVTIGGVVPPGIPSCARVYVQTWIVDAGGPAGFAASNALRIQMP